MNGSRIGRGRIGRLVVYGLIICMFLFLGFLYQVTTTEIHRLRELNAQCIHQQDALSAQLQVIYDYRERLEKTLLDEKSSNAAVRKELEQRVSREKLIKDKDLLESTQRLNALQQNYNILKTEHQDLKDNCKQKEYQALEDTKKLESTLTDLRVQLKKLNNDKIKSMENLKNKYLEIENEKKKLENNYKLLIENTKTVNSTIEHLKKENGQLLKTLDDVKKNAHFAVGGVSMQNSQVSPRQLKDEILQKPPADNNNNPIQMISPGDPAQQQIISAKINSVTVSSIVSSPSGQGVGAAPVKLQTKVKLPAGVVPIPQFIESNNNKGNIESAGQAPPENSIDSAKKPIPKSRKVIKNSADAEGHFKLKQGVQEVGDNDHIEKLLDFGNGDNNDDNPDGHYDEYYKGHNKAGNNGDPDQDDDYQFDYGRNNFNAAQND